MTDTHWTTCDTGPELNQHWFSVSCFCWTVLVSIVGSLRDREVACSNSDRQGSNFESCVWRTVSSQSSHHPQEVLLAQFSLYVHKGGLKPDSFHFICWTVQWVPAKIMYTSWTSESGVSSRSPQWKSKRFVMAVYSNEAERATIFKIISNWK